MAKRSKTLTPDTGKGTTEMTQQDQTQPANVVDEQIPPTDVTPKEVTDATQTQSADVPPVEEPEVPPPPADPEPPVPPVEPEAKVDEVAKPAAVSATPADEAAKLKARSALMFQAELAMKGYVAAMTAVAPMTPEEGAQWQNTFFTTMMDALNRESYEDFKAEWNAILRTIAENIEVFDGKNFRWLQQWPSSDQNLQRYRLLSTLAIATAPVETRKQALKDIVMSRVIAVLTDKQANMLNAFYG